MKLLILLIFLSSGECRQCDSNEECVPQQQCESFMTERAKLKEIRENSGRNNEEYRQLWTKLRGMVCNAEDQTVCCENSVSDSKDCSSEEEECIPASSCQQYIEDNERLGSFDNQSDEYQEISSKLEAQICEKTPGREERVCCRTEITLFSVVPIGNGCGQYEIWSYFHDECVAPFFD